MHVFDEAAENEVRIVIATNAAESSLTLPDVDHVICLGLCKVRKKLHLERGSSPSRHSKSYTMKHRIGNS